MGRLDFTKILFRESAARGSVREYEVTWDQHELVATMYDGNWLYNDNVKREDCQLSQGIGYNREYNSLAEDLYKLGVHTWDGFNKYNKHALDGWSFRLEIVLPGGRKLTAHGENKFPRNYREFKERIDEAVNGPKEY